MAISNIILKLQKHVAEYNKLQKSAHVFENTNLE